MADGVYMDGFETYLTADLPMRYTVAGAPTIASTGGRNNTGCLKITANTQSIDRAIPQTDTLSVMFAFYVEAFPGSICNIFFSIPINGAASNISINSNGTVYVGANALSATSASAVEIATWNVIEFQQKIANSGGYLKARLNGVEFCNLVGDTYSSYAYMTDAKLFVGVTGAKVWFDDLIVAYSGAASLAYIGDHHVMPVALSGAGDATMLTKGGSTPAATNWESVDDATPNGDVDYVYSATAGDKDLYTLANPGVAGNLFGLQVTAVARKDDAANRTGIQLIKSGGTEYEGVEFGLPQGSYQAFSAAWLTDPATGLAFTSSTLPQVGQKVKV